MRTRVKICGITRPQDALEVVKQGADAIGMVFYSGSSCAVEVEQAVEIVRGLPPFVTVVGLFVNAGREEIERTVCEVRIDMLQFHGDESPADCAGYGRPFVKAVRMRPSVNLHALRERYADASALLLDTYRKGAPGGTGATFGWERIPADIAGSVILAGGLRPDNVESAIRQVAPYAVDVSSGVEQEKGIKDAEKIRAFMRGVERANQ